MNKYEVALAISANLSDEDRAAVLEKVKGYIARYNGEITNVEEWGKRKLAYEIRKETEGFYYFIKVETADGNMSVELEKKLRLMMETVLRYLIIREDEE